MRITASQRCQSINENKKKCNSTHSEEKARPNDIYDSIEFRKNEKIQSCKLRSKISLPSSIEIIGSVLEKDETTQQINKGINEFEPNNNIQPQTKLETESINAAKSLNSNQSFTKVTTNNEPIERDTITQFLKNGMT